jgi:hypothetical protein
VSVPAADKLRKVPSGERWEKPAKAAADLLDAIDALHHRAPFPDADWCNDCSITWPCPTARLLHPEDGGERG